MLVSMSMFATVFLPVGLDAGYQNRRQYSPATVAARSTALVPVPAPRRLVP